MPQQSTYEEIIAVMGHRGSDGEMTKPRLRDMTLLEAWKLTLAFLVAIVVGFGLYRWYPCEFPSYKSVTALADALMVAGIIGLALEIFATAHLIEKTAKRLADEMTGMGLPPNIKSKISELASTKLARSNYKKEYRLKELGNGKLTVETTTTFDVENYGEKTEKYTPEADEEVVFNPKFSYLAYSFLGRDYSLNEPDLAKTRKDKHGTGTTIQVCGRQIKIPPRTKDPTAICKVTWVIEVTDLTDLLYQVEC